MNFVLILVSYLVHHAVHTDRLHDWSKICIIIFVEFQKTSSGGGKWSLTDIADHTQLGSPARLATKRRIIQSSSSQSNMDDTVRRLERAASTSDQKVPQ